MTVAVIALDRFDARAFARAFAHTFGDDADVERWSPLAAPAWLGRAPGPIGRFARRRAGQGGAPVLLAADAALRLWARDRTDRRYRAELALRAAIDRWAAREVRRRRPRVVVAPALAARRTFAAAREVGATTVLALDWPLLRALHHDLDRAAAVWPARRFLRRFRAPSWAIAAQDAERVLADRILVRGAYARAICTADGFGGRLGDLPASQSPPSPPSPPSPQPPAAPRTGRVRLAGLAAARHGVDTALAATRALGLTLVVRTGEGTEPGDLAQLPGVAVDAGPVDAVICPAVCETYAEEIRAAAASGLPVVASPGASLDGTGPDPFDAAAFADALARVLDRS